MPCKRLCLSAAAVDTRRLCLLPFRWQAVHVVMLPGSFKVNICVAMLYELVSKRMYHNLLRRTPHAAAQHFATMPICSLQPVETPRRRPSLSDELLRPISLAIKLPRHLKGKRPRHFAISQHHAFTKPCPSPLHYCPLFTADC